jgi:HEAT repeat protein
MLQRYYVSVALGLARYGQHALSRLVPLLTHPDSNRRIAAIIALRVIGDVGTRDTVANLKSDLDAGVRQQAERCDKIWGDGAGFPPHILS